MTKNVSFIIRCTEKFKHAEFKLDFVMWSLCQHEKQTPYTIVVDVDNESMQS